MKHMAGDQVVTMNMLEKAFDDFSIKLFRYFDKRFGELEGTMDSRFERVEKRLDTIEGTVDAIYARLDTVETEQAAMSQQLSRHERWITHIASETNVKLN